MVVIGEIMVTVTGAGSETLVEVAGAGGET